MTHPAVILAVAHAWSLRRAWAMLRNHNPGRDDDAGTIQSWRSGGSSHGGGTDPLGDAVLRNLHTGTHHTQLDDTVRTNVDQAYWLVTSARRDRPAVTGPALVQITAALVDVDPATAAEAGKYLADADKAIRRLLRIGPDWRGLDTNPPCPGAGCGVRLLRLWTSPPLTADWTVICAAHCRCTGVGCGCRMAVQQHGLPHIWSGAAAARLATINAQKEGAAA